jgi:hypothetical protein
MMPSRGTGVTTRIPVPSAFATTMLEPFDVARRNPILVPSGEKLAVPGSTFAPWMSSVLVPAMGSPR